jgi:uroporphyrin-3 C-methyltransferase
MSESETDDRLPAGEDAEFDEAPSPPEEEPAKRSGGFSGAIAWAALALALAAAGMAGWLAFDQWRAADEADAGADAVADLARSTERTLEDIDASLAGLRERLDEFGGRLDEVRAAGEEEGDRIDDLRDELDALADKADLVESINPRIGNLERSVASLQGIELDARNTYLLLEAEYYLQIANAQLQLAGNPQLASQALEQADDRLSQVGDPALTGVRRAIADEIAALGVMEKPDIAGATLTLASLAQVADSLPLKYQEDAATDVPEGEAADAGGIERAWNAVKDAANGLVTYSRPGEGDQAVLPPDAEPLIRSNLSLQLQAARLALLRGEQEVFEQSLDDADGWLERYFDTEQTSVSAARQTIAEIRDDYSRDAPPDISGSLRLLRQYQTMAESEE